MRRECSKGETRVEILEPALCSDAQLTAFSQIVLQGGEVVPDGLEERIRHRGFALVFLSMDETLVGVGALKRPRESYRHNLFAAACLSDREPEFPLELGWIVVAPNCRGRGYALLIAAAAMTRAGSEGVYATIHESNPSLRRALARLGFERSSHVWKSKRREGELGLYLRRRPSD